MIFNWLICIGPSDCISAWDDGLWWDFLHSDVSITIRMQGCGETFPRLVMNAADALFNTTFCELITTRFLPQVVEAIYLYIYKKKHSVAREFSCADHRWEIVMVIYQYVRTYNKRLYYNSMMLHKFSTPSVEKKHYQDRPWPLRRPMQNLHLPPPPTPVARILGCVTGDFSFFGAFLFLSCIFGAPERLAP